MKVVRLSASRNGRLHPQECSWYSFSLGAESTPQCHGTIGRNMSMKNPVTPPGIDPGTIRLVTQRLNHNATPGPYKKPINLSKYTAQPNEEAERVLRPFCCSEKSSPVKQISWKAHEHNKIFPTKESTKQTAKIQHDKLCVENIKC